MGPPIDDDMPIGDSGPDIPTPFMADDMPFDMLIMPPMVPFMLPIPPIVEPPMPIDDGVPIIDDMPMALIPDEPIPPMVVILWAGEYDCKFCCMDCRFDILFMDMDDMVFIGVILVIPDIEEYPVVHAGSYGDLVDNMAAPEYSAMTAPIYSPVSLDRNIS
jgi:hypothetical protein